MVTRTPKEMLSHNTAITERGWKVGGKVVDQASAVIPATAIDSGRRCEARTDYRSMCSYEMLEAIREESVVIGQGGAFVINRSTEGILLLMALAPHVKQLIEVRTSRSGGARTANIFETRWTRSLQVELQINLYLVGCKRIFGPCHYLSF
ncbi:MAG TPA: hypothetical protein VK901_14650 [Nitrospiraceae bacterium]|nr:hypothetical protein [Nitrospiraceae bacterium]